MVQKDRLDKLLMLKGFASSRDRAKSLIMSGSVYVNNVRHSKSGQLVDITSNIEVKTSDIPFVSRGGVKLEAALKAFKINLTDKVCMDVGASTGGFTDCMLYYGAKKVYCIDVGYGQLDYKLRNDSRVINIERTNFRNISNTTILDIIDFVSIDVSFISLLKILPKVKEFIHTQSQVICLIKPQFEAGKGEVGKGGVIRDKAKRLAIVHKTIAEIEDIGFAQMGLIQSPIQGQKGNVEYLLWIVIKDKGKVLHL